MAKKTPRPDTIGQRPQAPDDVIVWLEYYRQAALAGADAVPDPTSYDTINYCLAQRRYWQSVAKGIKWLISHAKRDISKRSKG